MIRTTALAVLAPLCLTACNTHVGVGPDRKPNIVLIFIDDLGWMDLACQGNKLVETPNIDRLARQGMRFTDAYAAAPVCSPSRAAILTGLSPAALGITNHLPDQPRFTPKNATLGPASCTDHLPLEHVTIAEQLQLQNYRTAFMGKWHLCGDWTGKDGGKGDARFHPEHQGFDLNIGGNARGGPSTYFDPYNIYALPDRKKGEYLPYRLADEAIAFIDSTPRDQPFFLFLANYTVHWPMEAPEGLLKKYESRKGPGLNDTRYGAMIEAMDEAVGRVLARLDSLGIADETLVVFTSDNGGYSGVADNRPLRAGKGFLYEGGIRVPLIVRWPGVTKPGTVSGEPVSAVDLHETFLNAGGHRETIETRREGQSLIPILTGSGEFRRRRPLFFHYPNYAFHGKNRLGGAVRDGRYKLILNYDDDSTELYDLAEDIGEKHDVSGQHSARTAALKAELKAWLRRTAAEMPVPRTRKK